MYHIEIFKARNKEFQFRLMHRNGNEIFKSSESYKRKATMKRIMNNFFDPKIEVRDLTVKK